MPIEIFSKNEDYNDIELFVKLAVSHYQFESIYLYKDGNGKHCVS